MRVVAGTARGRSLQAPPGQGTRPTSDRVREAMFSALVSLGGLEEASVVDLFAGSGALGIEALSRGAAAAIFVEQDRAALAVIRANLASVGLVGPHVTLIGLDALAAAATRAISGSADVVFADPPYRFERWPDLLAGIALTGFGGVLVAESGRPIGDMDGWDVVREKAYGSTVVTMLRPVCSKPHGGLSR
jgi:16S rRNA (guanine966-N2)-methyltransferase